MLWTFLKWRMASSLPLSSQCVRYSEKITYWVKFLKGFRKNNCFMRFAYALGVELVNTVKTEVLLGPSRGVISGA